MSFLEISRYKKLFIFVLIFSNSIIADDKKLLILGDSISAGFGIKQSQNWTTLLKSSFSKEGKSLKIINSSISGDTTSGGLSRISRDLNTYKPDFVLVELGGNDALRGYPISRIKQNLLKIISIISNNQSIPIIMQIKIPPNYGKKYIEAFENIYSEVASEMDVKLISFMLENVALREDLMQPDGIHPNKKAQPVIAEQIKEEIGFVPKIIKIHPLDIYQSNDGHFMYHTFVIVTPTEFEPNINHESQDYCWSKLRKLPRPLHQGARKTLLDKNNVKKLNLIVNSID